MKTSTRKAHWESIYQYQDTSKVSWHQKVLHTSLRLIDELNLKPTANIIDIGSGDSFLADRLLERGFSNITLPDISEMALTKIKKRLIKLDNKIKCFNENHLTPSGGTQNFTYFVFQRR